MQNGQREIAVIGGGPAGMMGAIYAAQNGALVTLFEKNDRLGKKLAITGKGRCNVTNNCSVADFMNSVTKNPRFLYAALNALTPEDTIFLVSSAVGLLKTFGFGSSIVTSLTDGCGVFMYVDTLFLWSFTFVVAFASSYMTFP